MIHANTHRFFRCSRRCVLLPEAVVQISNRCFGALELSSVSLARLHPPLVCQSCPSRLSKSQPVRPRVRPRIPSDNHHLAVDAIPQELIDVIIDNVPQPSLPSCSLVANDGDERANDASSVPSHSHPKARFPAMTICS